MDEIKLLLKNLNTEKSEGVHGGCGSSSPREAEDFMGRKRDVVSSELPHSKQLNIFSVRFLDKRKGYKKGILSHDSKSGQAILLWKSYYLKHLLILL